MTVSCVSTRYFVYVLVLIGIIVPIRADAQIKLHEPRPRVELPDTKQETPTLTEKKLSLGEKNVSDPKSSKEKAVFPNATKQSEIVVNELKSVDIDAVGLISSDQGGFPLNMWRGTEWKIVKTLIRRIPVGIKSKSLRRLARRLLITRAIVPIEKPVKESFLGIRVSRLLAMGQVEDALALLKTTRVQQDENLIKSRIEASLYNNDNASGCKAVLNAAQNFTGIYWLQATAFCQALSGEHARASLIADLLREREKDIEPIFFVAIDSLAGADGLEVSRLQSPTALHVAMMRAAKLKVPTAIINDASAAALRAVVWAPNADLMTRLMAAEKALYLGALSGERLIRLYLSIPFTPEELNRPIAMAEENWSPRTRALILRSAAAQKVPLAKAELLRKTWQIGKEHQMYEEIVGASLPIVRTIKPDSQLNWFAEDAARALFSGGHLEEGLAWYRLVSDERQYNEEARAAEGAFWHLAALADSDSTTPISPGRILAWYDSQNENADKNDYSKRFIYLSLLEAVGAEITPKLWHRILQESMTPITSKLNLAWQRSLKRSVVGKRLGESILLITLGGGEVESRSLTLEHSLEAIRALTQLGLEKEARSLAIETAIASGL